MNHKITIGWPGPVISKKYGSTAYEIPLKKVLSENFNFDFIKVEGKHFKNKYLRALEFIFNLYMLDGRKDLWIRDFYSTVFVRINKTSGNNLSIVHHLDFSGFNLISRIVLEPLKILFYYHNLRKMDAIVTVSEYWRKHFLERGYKNVYKIYNSFNLPDFNISDQEVSDFKKKYNLTDKQIIYLGNCQKAKGVRESFKALKDLDVYLVTSGEQKIKIPALNLNLEYRDYLKLLKASSIVITMSKFKEGWCRTAHEAMLLKTPVIGSGLGGMRELLEGGNQMVCPNSKDLKEKVKFLIKNHDQIKKMGESGYNFAKNFTLEKFEESWLDLTNKIVN